MASLSPTLNKHQNKILHKVQTLYILVQMFCFTIGHSGGCQPHERINWTFVNYVINYEHVLITLGREA